MADKQYRAADTRNKRAAQHAGWIMTEVMVSLAIVGLLLGIAALFLHNSGRFQYYLWAQQQCLNAAQAQLDALGHTGRALSDDVVQRLWPQVTLSVERSPGRDQWQGLQRVVVRAARACPGRTRPVTVQQVRYVHESGGQQP